MVGHSSVMVVHDSIRSHDDDGSCESDDGTETGWELWLKLATTSERAPRVAMMDDMIEPVIVPNLVF